MGRRTASTTDSPLEGFDEPPARRGRRGWLIALVVILLLALGYLAAQYAVADRIAAGTRVAGVEIGGLSPDEAQDRLNAELATQMTKPIQVAVADTHANLDPATAGLSFDAKATVVGLTSFSLAPQRLIEQLTGSRELAPVVRVDEDALDAAIGEVASEVATRPSDGSVAFVDGVAVATQPEDGIGVDGPAAAEAVRTAWLTATGPIELPTSMVEPQITAQETAAALAQAQTMVASAVWVEVGGQRAELPKDTIADAAQFVVTEGSLTPELNAAAIKEAVLVRTTDLETAPKDAHFVFNDQRKPKIKGGKAGKVIDADALAQGVLAASLGADRTSTAGLVDKPADTGRAELKKLGIKKKVVEFSTPLTAEPVRTANLANAAARLTGTLVEPGATFSVTDAVGPITAESGYREAHIIEGGIFVNGIGGGLSQMATTTYNVGFLLGMTDIEHKPHSYWFTRYPAGREATIYEGVYDMRWRNDSPYGVLISSWVEGGRLYVAAWSTPYYTVETTSGPHLNLKAPGVTVSKDPRCVTSSAGNSGFTITVTRKVTVTDTGEVVADEAKTWTYQPSNQMKCISGDEPEPEKKTDDTKKGRTKKNAAKND